MLPLLIMATKPTHMQPCTTYTQAPRILRAPIVFTTHIHTYTPTSADMTRRTNQWFFYSTTATAAAGNKWWWMCMSEHKRGLFTSCTRVCFFTEVIYLLLLRMVGERKEVVCSCYCYCHYCWEREEEGWKGGVYKGGLYSSTTVWWKEGDGWDRWMSI